MSFLIDPPRLGFRTCGPVRYVPWYLFLSSSRGCFVIGEHPEAPQAVGTPNNPINQVSLISSVTSFIVSYLKRCALVPVDSLPHLSTRTWARASCHAFTGATHSGRGGFKTCLPQCQSSFSVQIRGHLFYEPSYTPRFPRGLISKLWHKECYQTVVHIFNFLSSLSREPFINARQKFLPI